MACSPPLRLHTYTHTHTHSRLDLPGEEDDSPCIIRFICSLRARELSATVLYGYFSGGTRETTTTTTKKSVCVSIVFYYSSFLWRGCAYINPARGTNHFKRVRSLACAGASYTCIYIGNGFIMRSGRRRGDNFAGFMQMPSALQAPRAADLVLQIERESAFYAAAATTVLVT